jgi:hypothetical protein
MENVDFATYEQMDAAKRVLIEFGWTAKEQNVPERAIVGFAMCDPTIQEIRWFRWLPFGRELEPKIITCNSGEEFVGFLQSHVLEGDLFEPCDDMDHDMCGYAYYGEYKSGIAQIYRVDMNLLTSDESIHKLRNIWTQVQYMHVAQAKAKAQA